MNKKAENFQNYLDEKEIEVFVRDELEGDDRDTVVFRSHVTIEGQQLPVIVIFDNSIFSLIRVQISPRALTDENQNDLLKFLNDEVARYKPFKLYCNGEGNLMLEICLVNENDEINGDVIYAMFDTIIAYLNESYRSIMKVIW